MHDLLFTSVVWTQFVTHEWSFWCVCVPQAVTFLVIHQKQKKSLEEITNELCPVLSVQQLYRISTMYWDDR